MSESESDFDFDPDFFDFSSEFELRPSSLLARCMPGSEGPGNPLEQLLPVAPDIFSPV
jgi:hypothetical protein